MLMRKTLPLLTLLAVVLISGCASKEPVRASRGDARRAEKKCSNYECYMERIGEYRKEVSTDENGDLVIRWHMSVSKIRALGYGEKPTDGMYYKYYNEDCWFTVIFDEEGDVTETEWQGPGCWGDGL